MNFILLDRFAARYEQRIDISANFAKRLIRGDAQTAIGNKRSARRNRRHFDRINWRRLRIPSGMHFRSARKDLKRPNQIDDLGPWRG
jgi:hypothetical protein